MSLKTGDRIELEIDRLSAGGRGVGRHEGLVVFVPNTAPDERAFVEISRVKNKFAEAELVRIVRASPHRVAPPCPVAAVCGGCAWQHVDYAEQLRQKRALVADALRKFSGRRDIAVAETFASPNPFHYRNRIQVHFAAGELGFRRRGSHELVPIHDCAIADRRLNEALSILRRRLDEAKSPPTRIELSLTGDGDVIESSDPRFENEPGFAQVNQLVNERLIGDVVARIPLGTPFVLDLYAGSGNFAFPIARERRPALGILAVELHSKSVRRGRELALRLGEPGIIFEETKVESLLARILADQHPTTRPESVRDAVILLDPPRSGCARETLSAAERLAPKKILYVSCDPVTLARDLSHWPEETYRLVEVRPYDMFPQTDHVETLAVLERRG